MTELEELILDKEKCLYNLGMVLADIDNYPEAIERLKESLELVEKRDERRAIILCKQQLAKTYSKNGEYFQANELLQQCILESEGFDQRLKAYTFYYIGLNYHYQGGLLLPQAENSYLEALQLSTNLIDKRLRAEILTNLAEVYIEWSKRGIRDYLEKAAEKLAEANELARDWGIKDLLEYQEKLDEEINSVKP